MSRPAAARVLLLAACPAFLHIGPFAGASRVQPPSPVRDDSSPSPRDLGHSSGGSATEDDLREASDHTALGASIQDTNAGAATGKPKKAKPEFFMGPFTGIVLDRTFPRADFWGRVDDGLKIQHFHETSGPTPYEDLVFSAEYSDNTAVSDIVYYSVTSEKFCVGCGRGTGWQNDELLAMHERYKGRKGAAEYFATRADYNGVGHFGLDRGHQAPVASFNNPDTTEADLTNLPTNLSPQSSELNQNKWRFLEADLRDKAVYYHKDENEVDIDVITGPLYELPVAMVEAPTPKQKWHDLLIDGELGWCAESTECEGEEDDEASECYGKQVKSANTQCKIKYPAGADPRENPNNLEMSFSAGKRRSTRLRIPLGYFKLFVVKKGGSSGRQACAFIMDQIGSCLLVSVRLLSNIAHINLDDTEYGEVTSLDKGVPSDKNQPYTSYVNKHWCVPDEGTLGKKNACYTTKTVWIDDPEEITVKMIEEHWSEQIDD